MNHFKFLKIRWCILSRIFLRLIAISLVLLLSIGSYNGLMILSSLKSNDQPIWKALSYESYIAGCWPNFTLLVIGITLIYIFELLYHRTERLQSVLFWVAATGFTAIAIFPIGSYDIFGNIAFAHLHAHYGLNPYQFSIADINNYLSDPYLKNMWWISHGSPYGPMWTWLSYIVYHAAAGFGLIPLVFCFKFIGLIMHLLITLVVYKLAEFITAGRGSKAAIIYGMNPLAIFEIVASGHNDGPAILLLLLFIYFVIQKRYLVGMVIASLAATFKLTALIAIPFIIWKIIRDSGQLYALLCMISLCLLIFIIYQPLWVGADTLSGLLTTTGGYNSNSLPNFIYAISNINLVYPFRIIALIAFCFWYLYLLLNIRRESCEAMIISIGLGFLVFYLLGASVVHRWYYLWPLAVVSTIPSSPWTKVIIGQTMLLLPSYALTLAFGESNLSNACTYVLTWIPLIILTILHFKKCLSSMARRAI